MKNFSEKKVVEKSKTHLSYAKTFVGKPRRLRYNVTNTAQTDRPHMTIYYDACALHAGYLRLQTDSQNM